MLYTEPQSAQGIQDENQPTQQYSSPNPFVNEQKKKSDQRAGKKENNDSRVARFFKFIREYNAEIVTVSTAIMALFTIALFISTHLLWKSGEKHSERELRAYVGITDASIKKSVDPSQGLIKAEMTIRNAGQTPAYDFSLIATFDFHEIPRTEFAPYQSGIIRQSRGTLEPGAEVVVPLVAEKLLTAEHLKAVKEEKFAFFFYGKIEYRDAFGKNRFRNFRWTTGNDKSGTLTWQVCEEGNDSN